MHVAIVVEQAVCLGQEYRVGRAGRGDDVDGIGELVYLCKADEVAQQEDALAVGVGETGATHIKKGSADAAFKREKDAAPASVPVAVRIGAGRIKKLDELVGRHAQVVAGEGLELFLDVLGTG